jgi:hypothetical protein
MDAPTAGQAPAATPVPWRSFAGQAPDLAERIAARFTAQRHHVLATLTRNGSPRVSGTEVEFRGDDVLIGSMWGARKARDLQRDGRFAVHAHTGDGSMSGGDAKVSGIAVEVTGSVPVRLTPEADAAANPAAAEEQAHMFRLLIGSAVLTSIHPDRDRLIIETWRPGAPVHRVERR